MAGAMTSICLFPGLEPTAEVLANDGCDQFITVKLDGELGLHSLMLPGTGAVCVAYARKLADLLTKAADEIERSDNPTFDDGAPKPVERADEEIIF